MEQTFKKVLDGLLALTKEELRAELESVADDPLVKVFEVLEEGVNSHFINEDFTLVKLNFDSAFFQRLVFEEISKDGDFWLAANDELFLLAA